jgi:hypothetical protein
MMISIAGHRSRITAANIKPSIVPGVSMSVNTAIAFLLATGYAERREGVRPDGERLAEPFSQWELQQAVSKAREHRQID